MKKKWVCIKHMTDEKKEEREVNPLVYVVATIIALVVLMIGIPMLMSGAQTKPQPKFAATRLWNIQDSRVPI